MLRCERGPEYYKDMSMLVKTYWLVSDFIYDLCHQEDIREANEAVSPGGKYRTGWYYRFVGYGLPIPVTLPNGEEGYAESSFAGDIFQYTGYAPLSGHPYYHFKEADHSHEHLREEWLVERLEKGTILPINDAPTDLSVLRSVGY